MIPKIYNGRNKTFFMVDYEGLRNSAATAQLATELTPLMRKGNFSELLAEPRPVNLHNPFDPAHEAFPGNIIPQTLLSQQALNGLQYMPPSGLAVPTNNYSVNVLNGNTTDQTIDRIDQSLGQKVRLFFRYAWEDATLLANQTNPFNGYNQPVTDRNFVLGYTQVFTTNAVNDLRFGRQHTTIDSVSFFATPTLADAGSNLDIPGFPSSTANPGIPSFTITGYDCIGCGDTSNTPLLQTDTTWQGTDVFSWTHGVHSIAVGAEVRKLITLYSANNFPRGSFTFSGQYSGDGAADYILGIPASVTTPGALYPGGAEEYRDGFFVMDKWQLRQKLTLNVGVRYELPTVPESATGYGTILDQTDTHFIPTTIPSKIPFNHASHDDLAPRVGFAYRAAEKWVVRGGYGIYFNPNQLNTYTLSSTNPPFSTIFTYTNDLNNPTLSLASPSPAVPPGASSYPSAFTINPYLPTASMNQWSIDVERGLGRALHSTSNILARIPFILIAAITTTRRFPDQAT